MATDDKTPWGRVDDDGTVYVREGDAERAVGQYPDATPEEALAYFTRKYTELEGQVHLLEQRAVKGAPASDIASALAHLRPAVDEANAVGDLAALRARLEKLQATVGELTEKQQAEQRAAVDEALREREAIVVEAEKLASQDPQRIQWKQTSAELDRLFQAWQRHQQDGPRIGKGDSNELWKRFRAARSSLETHRRAFFSELDSVHKEARARKQQLAEQAEALMPKGADGIPDYRRLLDDWKRAGRAGKKVDDALWARFKAAGDALYGAKAEIDARDDEEFQGNLVEKQALLVEAEQLLKVTDAKEAKRRLVGIQRGWDAIGKVPRDSIRSIEDRLRKVEEHVRKLDHDHWERTNPEKTARSSGLASQLEDAIAKLEAEVAEAAASGDARKRKEAEEALAARKVWLDALG